MLRPPRRAKHLSLAQSKLSDRNSLGTKQLRTGCLLRGPSSIRVTFRLLSGLGLVLLDELAGGLDRAAESGFFSDSERISILAVDGNLASPGTIEPHNVIGFAALRADGHFF